jgi:hypothetical protein
MPRISLFFYRISIFLLDKPCGSGDIKRLMEKH